MQQIDKMATTNKQNALRGSVPCSKTNHSYEHFLKCSQSLPLIEQKEYKYI